MEQKKDGFPHEKAIVLPQEMIGRMQENPVCRMLYVTDIGYYPCASGHFLQRDKGSGQHILIYCSDGEGWYTIGKERCTVRKHQFFIIESGTPHAYAASARHPWSIYWIHFSGEKSRLFAGLFNRTFSLDDASDARSDDRIRLFNEMLVNLEMGYGIENLEYVTICLWYLLGSLRYVPQFRAVLHSQSQDLIQRVIGYMKDNLHRQLSLEDIARSVNYSPAYLGGLFAEKAGMSPIHYFNQLKIQRACQLLDFTDMKVKEIAFSLSFRDPYYFSKVFVRYMHVSPTEYRMKKKG